MCRQRPRARRVPQLCAILLDCARHKPDSSMLETLVTLVQIKVEALIVLTDNVQAVRALPRGAIHDFGSWGFSRAGRAEQPGLPLCCVDGSSAYASLLPTLNPPVVAEPEVAMCCGMQLAPRLARLQGITHVQQSSLNATRQIITGGLGALGLVTSRWLAQSCSPTLLLTSRNGIFRETNVMLLSEWRDVQCAPVSQYIVRCDMVDHEEVHRLFALANFQLHKFEGIWHAAGVLGDALLSNQKALLLTFVFGPKAHGACSLHNICTATCLRTFALFSSAAALLGGVGQSNYAAANACLDLLSTCRHVHGVGAVSVQWGPWANVGMAARGAASERMVAMEASSGFGRIELALGLAALSMAVHPEGPSAIGVLPVIWSRLLGDDAQVPSLLSPFAIKIAHKLAHECTTVHVGCLSAASASSVSLETVLKMVQRTAGSVVDVDAPLMEAGLDSLGAVELRNLLQSAAGGTSLPSTLVFDHQTARQLALVLRPEQAQRNIGANMLSECSTLSFALVDGITGEDVSLMGAACLEPGGVSDLQTYRQLIATCEDAISPFPSNRETTVTDEVYCGSLGSYHLFDNSAFFISPAETTAMDPQQRSVLEQAYAAFHSSGIKRWSLTSSLTGVAVGIWSSELFFASSWQKISSYGAMNTLSVCAGRVSFTLGLHGAAVAVDTACAASLVACHMGIRALHARECDRELVAGVNILWTSASTASLVAIGMGSCTFRCHTFDQRANGYVRSEACVAVALELSACQTVIQGVATRQDGRSARPRVG